MIRRCLDTNTLVNIEYSLHFDQEDRWFVAAISPLTGDSVIWVAREITERKRAEQEVQLRASEFAALHETTLDLAATQTDLPTVMHVIAQRAARLLSARSGAIYLYDPVRNDLELAAVKDFPAPLGTRLAMGEGMAGRVAQSREPLIIDDYALWDGRSAKYDGLPFTAALEVPMLFAGELIGVLGVTDPTRTTRKFTERDTRLLSLFAGQTASVVHDTRLLKETRARAEQLAILYDAGLALSSELDPHAQLVIVLDLIQKALNASRSDFFRYHPEHNNLTLELTQHDASLAVSSELGKVKFTLGEEHGLTGLVGSTREPLYLPDVTADSRWIVFDPEVRSAMWVPVQRENELIGVIAISALTKNAFSANDQRLLQLFASQVAVALVNSRLFVETGQRLADLEVVNKISTALRVAQTLDEMLPILLDLTLEVMHAPRGVIRLYDPGKRELRAAVSRGWREDEESRPLRPLRPGEGMAGFVFESGKPLLAEEVLHDPGLAAIADQWERAGISGAVIPIRAGQTVIGTFSISVAAPRELTPAEIRLLLTLTEIAGNAIQRTTLHQQTKHRLEQLAALIDIDRSISSSFDLRLNLGTLLGQVLTQLEIDAAEVLLFNSSSMMLEYFTGLGFRSGAHEKTQVRLGQGFAGRAALERRLIQLPNDGEPADFLLASPNLAGEGFVCYFGVPLIAKGQVKGVLELFHRSSRSPDKEWLDFLTALAGQAAIAIDNSTLFDGLQRSNTELTLAYDSTIEGWSHALDLRDKETEGHTERVTDITVALARQFDFSEAELVQIRWGGLLHDIGKMGVPDGILLKPGSLSDEEWVKMRKHPVFAYEMISPIRYLRSALDIPYCHHEKWDGTGYPRGLKGEQIPLTARIFAVVDVWDALISDRPYRRAWSQAEALDYLRSEKGRHFDPQVVDQFMRLHKEL